MTFDINEISDILKKRLEKVDSSSWEEVGTVVEVGDGIANVYGLEKIKAGELVEFETGQKGLAFTLEEYTLGVIIFDNPNGIKEGTKVTRTHKKAYINVGEGFLGRVVDTLGNVLDGKGDIEGDLYEMPLDRKAPGILYRQSVNEPLQTGITAIDAMIPIGCGQRELIIGDRETGKTSIAIDTIINQRHFYEEGNPVYCIYVAIGQKASTIANIVEELRKSDALKYTVIVAASASSSASMQCYAPFTGATIGEFFRDTGRRALVIYDDLSKQAIAYREISLLLRRSPGREAYPGDVFYLHSRLLERAAKIIDNDNIAKNMNDVPESIKGLVKGGGSLTALPIIEIQEGNVSAYIATNVISITDGQILLDSELFNSGFKPAINVGLSVSRVGSAAQSNAMKKVAGKLKICQAQFAELDSFAKGGSELDPSTQDKLKKGKIVNEMLKQHNHNPLTVGEQVIIIYAAMNDFFKDVSLDKIEEAKEMLLNNVRLNHNDYLEYINKNGKWDVIENKIKNICLKNGL